MATHTSFSFPPKFPMASALPSDVPKIVRRRERDILALADGHAFPVFRGKEGKCDLVTTFVQGPPDTPYDGTLFVVTLVITDKFPFASPSVAFHPRTIPFHPNVHEEGSVCCTSLNKEWAPSTTLLNVVTGILPVLLQHPNYDDPIGDKCIDMYTEEGRDAVEAYAQKRCRKIQEKVLQPPEITTDATASAQFFRNMHTDIADSLVLVGTKFVSSSDETSSSAKRARVVDS